MYGMTAVPECSGLYAPAVCNLRMLEYSSVVSLAVPTIGEV